jgi:hypothetical protein
MLYETNLVAALKRVLACVPILIYCVWNMYILYMQGPMLRGTASRKHSSSSSNHHSNGDVMSLRQRLQQQQQHDSATIDVMLSAEHTAHNVPIRGMPTSTSYNNGMTANQIARAFASAIQQQQQQQQQQHEEQLKSDGMPTATDATNADTATTAGDDQYRLVLYVIYTSKYTSSSAVLVLPTLLTMAQSQYCVV